MHKIRCSKVSTTVLKRERETNDREETKLREISLSLLKRTLIDFIFSNLRIKLAPSQIYTLAN